MKIAAITDEHHNFLECAAIYNLKLCSAVQKPAPLHKKYIYAYQCPLINIKMINITSIYPIDRNFRPPASRRRFLTGYGVPQYGALRRARGGATAGPMRTPTDNGSSRPGKGPSCRSDGAIWTKFPRPRITPASIFRCCTQGDVYCLVFWRSDWATKTRSRPSRLAR